MIGDGLPNRAKRKLKTNVTCDNKLFFRDLLFPQFDLLLACFDINSNAYSYIRYTNGFLFTHWLYITKFRYVKDCTITTWEDITTGRLEDSIHLIDSDSFIHSDAIIYLMYFTIRIPYIPAASIQVRAPVCIRISLTFLLNTIARMMVFSTYGISLSFSL